MGFLGMCWSRCLVYLDDVISFGGTVTDNDDPQPPVEFSNWLFWEEDIAEPSRRLPDCGNISAFQAFPVIDQNELELMDSRIGEFSVLSLGVCDPSIIIDSLDDGISEGDEGWLCLLYSANSGSEWDNSVAAGLDCKRLIHWRGVVWDPGIVGKRCLHVCYDCLCLIALCCDAMMIGLLCLRGLGLGSGIAEQLPGN